MADGEAHMSEAQSQLIAKFRTVRQRCQEWAEQANAAGLPILARECDYLGKQLEAAIGNQVRAFREGALGNPETKES